MIKEVKDMPIRGNMAYKYVAIKTSDLDCIYS
jgi:hypothetical protein